MDKIAKRRGRIVHRSIHDGQDAEETSLPVNDSAMQNVPAEPAYQQNRGDSEGEANRPANERIANRPWQADQQASLEPNYIRAEDLQSQDESGHQKRQSQRKPEVSQSQVMGWHAFAVIQRFRVLLPSLAAKAWHTGSDGPANGSASRNCLSRVAWKVGSLGAIPRQEQ